jgi:hypothetical protein
MSKNLLFAVDTTSLEVIVSESPKGSTKINFIERISSNDNEILYHATVTLTCIAKAKNFNVSVFKAMDKVCQMLYNQYKEEL